MVSWVQIYYLENPRNKHFISFKLRYFLVLLAPRAIPCCPAQNRNPSAVQHLHAAEAPRPLAIEKPSQLSDGLSWYPSACVQIAFILVNDGPQAIPMTISITVYCDNYSMPVLVIVGNLLLSLMYKLNFNHKYIWIGNKQDI